MNIDDYHDLGLCPTCERDLSLGRDHAADCVLAARFARETCKRHAYRRVALAPVVHLDGSANYPYHDACRRCGKVKRNSFGYD